MNYYNTPASERIIKEERTYTLKEFVTFPIYTVKNTPESPFWYTGTRKEQFQKRFAHEKARVGARFFDGNNGDMWRVIAADIEHKRIIIQNLDQCWMLPRVCYWE